MELLYSNILPLGIKNGQKTIIDCFNKQMKKADRVEIAVGYISTAALDELRVLVESNGISDISLIMGMYFVEGMPERAYHMALKLNQKWKDQGKGEIRLVRSFKYHGKVYCFYKDGVPFSAIIGSANLGVIKPEASNRRQYELAVLTEDSAELNEISEHLTSLKSHVCSCKIDEAVDVHLIHEENTSFNQVELVTSLPISNINFYKKCVPTVSFYLNLKVPKAAERFIDDGKHYTKSNINVCYAAPRNKRKARDWFETQLTVGADVYKMTGYPKKNKPFFVVTDDGYWFKAHTTSDNNKQFSAVGDELIMGRWLKGRLAAAGLVTPVNNTALDKDRLGMITQEMLDEYGCDRLLFQKTGQKALDTDSNYLDVWMLSFIGSTDQ